MKYLFSAIFIVWAASVFSKSPLFSPDDIQNPPSKVIRICCAFGSDLRVLGIPFYKKNDIISINDIGKHHYLGHRSEGNGIVYTENGGFIDLGHLRDYADWTAYLYNLIQYAKDNDQDIVLDLGNEGGAKALAISASVLTDTIQIYHLAGSIAYDLSVWHEIATWFGASYIPFLSEQFSSFSPDDLYSNLLGVSLGIEAIKSDLAFDEAMTILLMKTLDSLGVVSESDTYGAMESVNGLWWTRSKSLPSNETILKRHMSLSSDSTLLPLLVPVHRAGMQGVALKKLEAELSQLYTLSIKINGKFSRMPWKTSHFKNVVTQHDFDEMIKHIEEYESNSRVDFTSRNG